MLTAPEIGGRLGSEFEAPPGHVRPSHGQGGRALGHHQHAPLRRVRRAVGAVTSGANRPGARPGRLKEDAQAVHKKDAGEDSPVEI